jgi:phospholipase/carboxylesterase
MRSEKKDSADATAGPVVVLLHGFQSVPDDLAPFARSLGVKARFFFPEGPVDLAERRLRGRAWWAIDVDKRHGPEGWPEDISDQHPVGLSAARARLDAILDEAIAESGGGPLFVGGFSQGAMLACDLVLRSDRDVAGLVLFSGAAIAADEWRPLYPRRRGLRTFVSHGDADRELSFASAESFQNELAAAGWDVTWAPFAGGHEIPLVVWRSFKRWLTREPRPSSP